MQASSKLEVVSTLMVDVETKGKNYLNFYDNGSMAFLSDEFFLEAYPFIFEIAPVRRENKLWNYIKKDGTLLLKEDVMEAYNFNSYGLAVVRFKTKLYAVINKYGEKLIDDEFLYLNDYFEKYGVALVKFRNGLYNFLKPNGKFTLKKDIYNAEVYTDLLKEKAILNDDFLAVEPVKGKFWIYNMKEGLLSKEEFFNVILLFEEVGVSIVERSNKLYNVINKEGKFLLEKDICLVDYALFKFPAVLEIFSSDGKSEVKISDGKIIE